MTDVERTADGCVSVCKQARVGQLQPIATGCFMEGSLTTGSSDVCQKETFAAARTIMNMPTGTIKGF